MKKSETTYLLRNPKNAARLLKAVTELSTKAITADWQKENSEAISAYNQSVEEHGCYGDKLRAF